MIYMCSRLFLKGGKSMIFAGIVAGGCGSRMKYADIPKQFLEIGNEPIIIKTAKQFLKIKDIDKVYIGIKPDWHEYMCGLADKFSLDKNRLSIIDGGANRNSTVMNIIDSIKGKYGLNQGDFILTHDAVRPFVSQKIISDNIACVKKFSACGTYIPAVDTIVKSQGKIVDETLNRKILYQAQTPQSFEVSQLAKCFESLNDKQKSELTDTCSIFTACGKDIHIVLGDPTNFKITSDNDLAIAKALADNKV